MPKQKPYKKHFIGTTFTKPTSVSLSTGNPDKSAKTVPNDCYENQLKHLH